MTFRIAHLTDVHWTIDPSPWRLGLGKRLLGTLNLYLGGRRYHFDDRVRDQLVADVLTQQPDLVVVTGDLTSQAIPAEFELARKALDPILSTIPTFVIPGNHDAYTFGAFKSRRIQRYFGPWMGLDRHGPVGRLDVGPVTVLGLDPNRPALSASGEVPGEQLDRLAEALSDPALRDRFVVLALHYPILGPGGSLYDNRSHGLVNVRSLIDVLDRAPVRPRLAIHGHKHHGYSGLFRFNDGHELTTHNPGSGGYLRHEEAGRAGAFNLYTLRDGQLAEVERHLFDGDRFQVEPGGLYASGF